MRRRMLFICSSVLGLVLLSAAGVAIASTLDGAEQPSERSAAAMQTVLQSQGISGIVLPSETPDLVDEKVRSSDFVYAFSPIEKIRTNAQEKASHNQEPGRTRKASSDSASLVITAHVLPARIIVLNERDKVIAVSGNAEAAGAADTVYIVRRGNLSGTSLRLTDDVWADAGSFIAEFNERHQ